MLHKARSLYFLNPKDSKQFWKTVKYVNIKQSTIPVLELEGSTAKSDTEKAEMLNTFKFQQALVSSNTNVLIKWYVS